MRQNVPVHHFTLYDAYMAKRRPKIFLAEDDKELRTLIASSLAKDGYEVVAVSDGRQLLDLLGSELLYPTQTIPVDLIISDVRMPGATGLDVLSGLRAADWTTPFILITAFGDDETHQEGHRLGAMIFDKPFDLDDLRTAVVKAFHSLH